MSASQSLDDLVQQWACTQDPNVFFKDITNDGVHALRFANSIHKYMLKINDFSLLPKLVEMLEVNPENGIPLSYLNFVSDKIIQGDKNFELMLLLSQAQQDKLLILILQNHPKKITQFENILGRKISEEVIFKSLIPNLNDLHHMNTLSPYISSKSFLSELSKVTHKNYPSGGVKLFAFWLAVPGYNLKMDQKEFSQFDSMVNFLDEKTMDKDHIKLLEFAKRLLNMRHETTNLEQFIQRSKIIGALPTIDIASPKRKI